MAAAPAASEAAAAEAPGAPLGAPLVDGGGGQGDGGEDACQPASFIAGLQHGFGSKDIGFFAGCALLVNNIIGPGLPQLPNMFAEAGWLAPTLCLVAVWLMTTLSSAMYCEAMRKIPGNEHFCDRVEYTTIVKYYFGRRWYVASQIGLNGALQSLNIASIIQSAQVVDNAVAVLFGRTCALNFTPFLNVWEDHKGVGRPVAGSDSFLSCFNTNDLSAGNAWGCHVVFTVGFALTMAMAIPCGRWNLDDNMAIQVVAFILTLACGLAWVAISLMNSWEDITQRVNSIPAVNSDARTGSQAAVLGVVLFNWGFVTTVPSWINEKRPRVSTNRTLWISTLMCVITFLTVGLAGAMAFPDVLQGQVTNSCRRQVGDPSFNCPNDLMQVLTSPHLIQDRWHKSPVANFFIKLSVYAFPVVAVVSGIPVFSIVVKYNMVENGFSTWFAFLWGVVLPWVVAFPLLYMPNVLAQFINFTSLVFVAFTDFIVPLAIYRQLQRLEREGGLARRCMDSPPGCMETVPPEGVHVHHALPPGWRLAPAARGRLAAGIATLLTGGAVLATVLTIGQGSYALDQQVCALVGS